MPRNTSGLKRTAGPGRPKGLKNKVTLEMREWYARLMDSKAYRASARERILTGRAPHLESHVHAVLMPKTEQAQIAGAVVIRWAAADDEPA